MGHKITDFKTIKEWLKELPEPFRTQALNNADKIQLKEKAYSLSQSVAGAFLWEKSNEGSDYWLELHKQL